MGGDWGVAITGITAATAFSEGASKSLFTKPIPIVNDASTSKSNDDETSNEDTSPAPTASSNRRHSEPVHRTIYENGEESHARPGRPKMGLNKCNWFFYFYEIKQIFRELFFNAKKELKINPL